MSRFTALSRYHFARRGATKYSTGLMRAVANGKRAEKRAADARDKLQRLKFAPPPRMRKGYSGDYRFIAEQGMQRERDKEIAVLEAKVRRAEAHVTKWEKVVDGYRDKMMEQIQAMTRLKKEIDA